MISDNTIQQIREQADVLEVIQDYLTVKKKGQYWWACCPFHNEKTPSFSVTPSRGIYKCFGCGESGDAISFVMKIDGLSYTEALRQLAKKYAIEIEENAPTENELQKQSEKETLQIVLNYARDYFRNALLESDTGKSIGLSYFKERGYRQEQWEKFELGYSFDKWDAMLSDAKSKGYNLDVLEKAGLIVRKENKEYDRFRGRVIFPIHNLSGKPIAFGARTLKKDDKPKYLNSPETEVYHKSDVLYGIYQAKQAIRRQDKCYLVEGYTDVISLHQAGVENVVASSGTSLTEGQIKLIKRFTNNITVLYDGDQAGIKASLRGIDLILEGGLDVKVVRFPEGEDPDSYAQKLGSSAFQSFLEENERDFIVFKTELSLKDAKDDPIKKAEVIRSIIESVMRVPDPIKRSTLFQVCSNLLDIEQEILITEGNKFLLKRERQKQKERNRAQNRPKALSSQSPPSPAPNTGTPDIPAAPPPDFESLGGLPEGVLPPSAPPPSEDSFVATPEGDDTAIVDPQEDSPLVQEELSDAKQKRVWFQEYENIRLLILHGSRDIEGEEKVCHYFFSENSEIGYTDKIFNKIFTLYKGEVDKGTYPEETFFLHHEDEEIKKTVIDMVTGRHVLSENWGKQGIKVPEMDEDLPRASYKNLIRWKYEVSKASTAECLKKLQHLTDIDEIEEFQRLFLRFKQQESELAKILGIVIS